MCKIFSLMIDTLKQVYKNELRVKERSWNTAMRRETQEKIERLEHNT